MTDQAVKLRAADVERFGREILKRLGAPEASSAAVAEHLVTAHVMGLTSHGIIRFTQYSRDVRDGRIDATAVPRIEIEGPTVAVVDGGGGFGQLTARCATDVAIAKARDVGVAIATTRRCNHVGRLGAFVETAARAGVVSIAVATVPRSGHFVVPWGGIDGRFGTNPIAYGFPTSGDPIVGDFATSVIPEGRIRIALHKRVDLPEGAVLDADGRPTRDPAAFYGPPMGAILPLGGPVGHKGFGLALLVELLGATLAGHPPSDGDRSINGFTIFAVDQGAFAHPSVVTAAADELVEYVHSSRPAPGHDAVRVPGEPEYAAQRAAGPDPIVEVDAETWHDLLEIARSVELEAPGAAGARDGSSSGASGRAVRRESRVPGASTPR
jgi:LDH2 family malate/lactate/ureidoglycolate dehydrogenase